tara:strand:- start:40355 stop:41281 length:927 start_codon:yes stop_codon:yes gene_type:complete
MKRLTFILTVLSVLSLNAQEIKPFVKVFTNFNHDNNKNEFELKRSYLGCSYEINEEFSTNVTFDVGNNSAGSSYTAFLKIASLSWKPMKKSTINMGMIGTKNFKFMEKSWGKRYIEKSALDKEKWASAADLGLSFDYKIFDNFTIDGQILNGEGYTSTQDEDGLLRYGFGGTYKLSNFSIRLFRDIKSCSCSDIDQEITTAAISYSNNGISIGFETDMMENSNNSENMNRDIMSIYGSYKIFNKYTLFGRFDEYSSEDSWDDDGTYTIFGVETQLTEGVKAAANIRNSTNTSNDIEDKSFYLNLEYKF